MPTTVQVTWPVLTCEPTDRPANSPRRAAAGDDLVGAERQHPPLRRCGRRSAPAASPARCRAAGRWRRSSSTASADRRSRRARARRAAGCSRARMPGACLMTSTASPARPLDISSLAPPRMMRARSGWPAFFIAARKPSAIDSTATNTMTTPAMPTTATADEPRRWRMVRMLSQATEKIWVKKRHGWVRYAFRSASVILSRIAAGRRQDAGERCRPATISATPSTMSRGGSVNAGSMPPVGSPPCTMSQARNRPEPAADEGDEQRLGQHQREHRRVREAEGLEHGQLAGALAHRLRHGVADDEQDGEEHRRQDGDHDRADVADLLGEALDEPLLGGRLGLGLRVGEHRRRRSWPAPATAADP